VIQKCPILSAIDKISKLDIFKHFNTEVEMMEIAAQHRFFHSTTHTHTILMNLSVIQLRLKIKINFLWDAQHHVTGMIRFSMTLIEQK
jgi:hypothetical protein